MNWDIEFFNAQVESQVRSWPAGIRASFVRIAERIQSNGPDLGMPYTRAFGSGLFEIRAKGQEGIGRALFCTHIGHTVVILHAFVKKTQKTPPKELAVAMRRLKEVKHEQ